MKSVLADVKRHRSEYTGLPLFQFMRDENRSAWERLSFYPCMAHFIMSFGDLNRYIMRKEPAQDMHQSLVNAHSYEDDHHWPWYLEDFVKLGFDRLQTPSEWMRFLWSDETAMNRILMYKLTAMIEAANSTERLVIIEAIEETGNVLFSLTAQLAAEIWKKEGLNLRYCGEFHLSKETGHAMNTDHKVLESIELKEEERAHALELVDEVFSLFTEWTKELHRYALRHPLQAPVRTMSERGDVRQTPMA